jgi:hypothetical protein
LRNFGEQGLSPDGASLALKAALSGFFKSFASGDTDWNPHVANNVPSISGEMISGCVMRRKVNGQWQYREMTDGELRSWNEAHL